MPDDNKDGQNATNKTELDDNQDVVMNDDQPLQIAAASTRAILQPFWPHKARNWFRLAEIQFNLQKIRADKDKYWHTLTSISPETYDTISDLLQNPPEQDQYETLKATLLDRLAPSDERQLEALLSGQDIGDRRPSEALRHIRTLAENDFPDKIIRSLWVRKMPEIIRIALAAQPETTTTDALAKMADRMYEVRNTGQQHQHIQAINRPSRSVARSGSSRDGDRRAPSSCMSFEERLSRIEAQLNRMSSTNRSRSGGRRFPSYLRSRSNSRPRNQHNNNNNRKQGTCWYHKKFGSAARRCNKPCSFGSSTPTADMDLDEHTKN